MSESMMQRLRSETRLQHDNLEASVDTESRLTNSATYRKLLETFYGLYFPLEEQILRSQTSLTRWLPDISQRMRSGLLRDDLQTLGSPISNDVALAAVPTMSSDAELLGCLYVLEGSSLGGQILYRMVNERLGYDAARGGSFFHGYGGETGSMWKRFGSAVNSYAESAPQEQNTIVASAQNVFTAFQKWMEPGSRT